MKQFTITVSMINHRGADQLALFFPYDVKLIEAAKSIEGIRWSKTHRCWYLPATKENFRKISRAFEEIAWIDLTTGNDPEIIAEEKASKQKETPLSPYKNKVTPAAREQVDKMVRNLHANGYSDRSIRVYKSMVELFLGFTGKDASKIDMDDVRNFQYQYWVKHEYSNSTQRQFISALRHLIAVVPDMQLDPETLDLPRKEKNLPKVLSEEEIMSILGVIRNMKHFVILAILYSSGLRVGELLNLRIEDLDFDRMQIHIRKGKGKKDRYVGMSRHLAPVIRNYIMKYRPQEYLIAGQHGGKYTDSSVRQILQRAAREAGIHKHVTPHMLRHSYATHMLEGGVDIRHIQELLGHNKPETTMIYTHVTTKQLTDIKSPLDQLVEKLERNNRNNSDEKFLLSGK